MKSIKIGYAVLAMLILLTSCGKEKSEYKVTELVLTLDKTRILDDNTDAAMVTVRDQNSKDISSMVDILVNGTVITGSRVVHDLAGSVDVHAEYKGIISNTESITVVEDIGLKYDRMVLIEQFTATWCGWCPRAITAVDDVTMLGEDIVHIAYHMSGDVYNYSFNGNLFESFGLSGIPAVVAGREIVWDLSRPQLSNLYKEVRTGLSVSYTGDATETEVIIDVSFGKFYPEVLNITAYLIEDKLLGDQNNYYNDDASSPWFNLGDVLFDFEHDNVMRKTLTNMFGDVVPSASIDIGSEYRLVLNPTNTNISDLNNSSVVAFVSYGSGPNTDVVINAISCDFGESVESQLVAK